jgi:DNA-binding MarR family transcriptional regulator
MSIALDAALYLREQKLTNPLTVSERGMLFTLLFRVGSNPFTWISQASLATELDIDIKNVQRTMKRIANKGLIEVQKDTNDKRKNLYRPAEFLINYHQQNHRECTKKYGTKSSPNIEDRGQNRPINRGQNRPILNSTTPSQIIENNGVIEEEILPKAKEEIKIKQNKSDSAVDNFELPTWLNKADWEEFKQFRKEMKLPLSLLAEKRALTTLIKLKEQGNDPEEVINQSIINNWKGLFPLTEKQKMSAKKEMQYQTNPTFSDVNKQSTSFISIEESIKRDRLYREQLERELNYGLEISF